MSTSASSPAQLRWRAFLQQIAERHRSLAAEAIAAASNDNAASAYAICNGRMVDLEAKIIATWNEKVEGAYEAEGLPHDTWWADRTVGADLAIQLENERERAQIHHFADPAHRVGSLAAELEWLAMRNADRALRHARSPRPLDLIIASERAQIAYWRAYVSARAVNEPNLRDVAHEVRSRMDAFYNLSAEFEEAWRNAGRPRTPV